MRFKWALVLLVSFWSFGWAEIAISQTQPLFPMPDSLPAFQPPSGTCASCTYFPTLILSGDFDGDGKVDLAYLEISNEGTADEFVVTVYGSVSGPPNQIGFDLKQCSVSDWAAADLNGDGRADLIMACTQGYTETLLSSGNGTFHSPSLSTLPSGNASMVVADFNGDGLPDIAYTVFNPPSLIGYAIGLNTGGGQFAAPKTYSLSLGLPHGIAAGDFNGDGKQDLAFGTGYILGNGDGTFGTEQSLPSGISQFTLGDFNKDGYTDLAFSQGTVGTTPGDPIELIAGSSSGLSAQPIALTGNNFAGVSLQAVKLTATGSLDLVATSNNLPTVLVGHGDGSFSTPLSYGNTAGIFADINADGTLDMVANVNGLITVIYGNGDGSLEGWPRTITSGQVFAVSDFNGDGLTDAVAQAPSYKAPQVYLSTGDGRFQLAPQGSTIGSGDFGTAFLAADLNGDGHQDVMSISQDGVSAIHCAPGPRMPSCSSIWGKATAHSAIPVRQILEWKSLGVPSLGTLTETGSRT